MENFEVIISAHESPKKGKIHRVRKGISTHECAGTTCPPSLTPISLRGKWSMGKTMDTCFQFGEVGIACLGRVLLGLDPIVEEIAMLPPCFTEVMENKTAISASHLTFGEACDRHSNQIYIIDSIR